MVSQSQGLQRLCAEFLGRPATSRVFTFRMDVVRYQGSMQLFSLKTGVSNPKGKVVLLVFWLCVLQLGKFSMCGQGTDSYNQ